MGETAIVHLRAVLAWWRWRSWSTRGKPPGAFQRVPANHCAGLSINQSKRLWGTSHCPMCLVLPTLALQARLCLSLRTHFTYSNDTTTKLSSTPNKMKLSWNLDTYITYWNVVGCCSIALRGPSPMSS
ncbi:hypothetical protein F4777DRAFT_391750 [Nemania sp. FL0916]|nr:hypothetical protein F4777DRAFT_391750 [Nemania sp. FL0916]